MPNPSIWCDSVREVRLHLVTSFGQIQERQYLHTEFWNSRIWDPFHTKVPMKNIWPFLTPKFRKNANVPRARTVSYITSQ